MQLGKPEISDEWMPRTIRGYRSILAVEHGSSEKPHISQVNIGQLWAVNIHYYGTTSGIWTGHREDFNDLPGLTASGCQRHSQQPPGCSEWSSCAQCQNRYEDRVWILLLPSLLVGVSNICFQLFSSISNHMVFGMMIPTALFFFWWAYQLTCCCHFGSETGQGPRRVRFFWFTTVAPWLQLGFAWSIWETAGVQGVIPSFGLQ